jgi:hypothetical protein
MINLPNPADDGEQHINCWTQAKTRLGRLATNLSDLRTRHPDYGLFRCAEGLYYYLKTGMRHEDLRAMDGFSAKNFGSAQEIKWNNNLWAEMKVGIRNKIEDSEELRELVVESSLPFEHYYVYHGRVVVPRGSDKFIQVLEEIRSEMFAESKR